MQPNCIRMQWRKTVQCKVRNDVSHRSIWNWLLTGISLWTVDAQCLNYSMKKNAGDKRESGKSDAIRTIRMLALHRFAKFPSGPVLLYLNEFFIAGSFF